MKYGKQETIECFIPIRPVPKGRPRRSRSGGMFTDPKTRAYEAAVALVLRKAMMGLKPIKGPLAAVFYISPEGSTASFIPMPDFTPSKLRGDVDNYVKAILDAANGIVFEDDKQVMCVKGTKQ